MPVPKAADLAELNRRLLDDSHRDEQRCIAGRDQTVGAALLIEQQHLLPLATGVFRKLRYDNLKAAVKKILRGQRREETARFIAFRSHWHFDSEFCTPAEGPSEKVAVNVIRSARALFAVSSGSAPKTTEANVRRQWYLPPTGRDMELWETRQ